MFKVSLSGVAVKGNRMTEVKTILKDQNLLLAIVKFSIKCIETL
jgi:hypothetical protein